MAKKAQKRSAARIESTSTGVHLTERTAKICKNKQTVNGFGQFVGIARGKFSDEESRKVRESIELYCRSHNITVARLCSEQDNRTDSLRGAWMEIAQVLQNRTVQSVYRHGLRIMHPFKRGAWSDEELAQLRLLVTQHGKKWAEIATRLNRSSDSCRDKYREFSSDFTKGRWKEDESKQLEKVVRDYLKVGDDMDIVQVSQYVESKGICIPWEAISKRMGDRSRLSCFKKFEMLAGICQKRKSDKKKGIQKNRERPRSSTVSTKAPSRTKSATATKKQEGETITTSASATNNTTSSRTSIQSPTSTSASTVVNPRAAITNNLPISATTVSSPAAKVETVAAAVAAATAAVAVDPPTIPHISTSTPNPIHAEPSINAVDIANEINPSEPSINASDIANVMKSTSIPMGDTVSDEYDRNLMSFIAASSYSAKAEVDWASIRYPCGNAEERWDDLLDTFVENMDDEDIYDRPIWETARLMLSSDNDDKVEQAEIAARTVEAVFSL